MFRKLLLPIDDSESALASAAEGLRLAQYHGATVILVSVVDRSLIYLPAIAFDPEGEAYRELITGTEKTLKELERQGRRMGLSVRTVMREGKPPEEILDVAQQERADLIVMAAHSHGPLAAVFLGSVSQAVLLGAKCPVLIYGEHARRSTQQRRGPIVTMIDSRRAAFNSKQAPFQAEPAD